MIHQDYIRQALLQLDCSGDFLCALAELGPKKLSMFLRDIKDLDRDELTRLLKTIEELKALQEDLDSVPIAFKNPKIIGALLARKRAGLRLILLPLGVPEVIRDFEQSQGVTDAGVKS